MSLSQESRKIIGIIGGGIAGPVLAIQILSHPILSSLYKPIIFEQCQDPYHDSPRWQQSAGAAIAITPNGLYPLYQLGLKQAVEEASCEVEGLAIWRVYGIGDANVGDEAVEMVAPSKHKPLSRLANISYAADLESNIRALGRGQLMFLLNEQVIQMGGEVLWDKQLSGLKPLPGGRMSATFNENTQIEPDLVVGADGGWSMVRKHILTARYGDGTAERWEPYFWNASNIYGISNLADCQISATDLPPNALEDTHACWLDRGHLSSSLIGGGKIRWDLQLPETEPPPPWTHRRTADVPPGKEAWESQISQGIYSRSRTVKLLRRHAGIYHPLTGTFGRMLAASDRIIHSPLRQRVWEEDEIHFGNTVVIGDAARLLLPTSGQGTSFAIEDATVLADALLKYPLGELDETGCQKALREYARRRVPRGKQMAKQATLAGELGLGRTWIWRGLRDWGSAIAWLGNNQAKKDVKSWPFGDRFDVAAKPVMS